MLGMILCTLGKHNGGGLRSKRPNCGRCGWTWEVRTEKDFLLLMAYLQELGRANGRDFV